MMPFVRIVAFLSFLFAVLVPARAQVNPAVQDTSSKIKVESSVTGEYFLRGDHYVQRLTDNVRLRQDSTLVYCDIALIDQNDAILTGSVIIEQGDSVKIFAD